MSCVTVVLQFPVDSCIISFLCWFGFGMLLLGKTQKNHPGDLPPTVPDQSPPPLTFWKLNWLGYTDTNVNNYVSGD